MKTVLVMAALFLIAATNAGAACTASSLSSPDDTFGQRFDCDDGSTVTYKRGTLFDSLEHRDKEGQTETYRANGLSDIGDEYNDLTGRQFSDGSYDPPTLKRGGFSGDKIEGIGDN